MENRTRLLILRGISDFADPSKSVLEQETKGAARELAIAAATAFLPQLLASLQLPEKAFWA